MADAIDTSAAPPAEAAPAGSIINSPPADPAPAATETEAGATPAAEPGNEEPEAEAPTGAPEAYETFTLPEGVEIDEATLGEATEMFKDIGLPQDKAQKLVDFYTGKLAAAAEAPQKLWEATQTEWQGQVRSDPEIGGAKLDAAIATAAKAIDKFGGPALRDALDITGAGNHPEVVRFFARVGATLSEAEFVTGSPKGSAAAKPSAATVLFPNDPFKAGE
jgi:hypothetical protein